MAKQGREGGASRGPVDSPSGSGGPMRLATLAGVGLLLVVTVLNWRTSQLFQKNVATKLEALSTGMSQLSGKVDTVARGAARPQGPSGPDPNKVYTVKTAGAPSVGPANAPVVIAEFSDFQ